MKSKKSLAACVVIVLAVVLFAGCAAGPLTKREIGAGVGAAGGAAAGAIIGNQAGHHSGAGAAIGGVFGGFFGWLLGDQLQAQDNEQEHQLQKIERQQREIEQLRRQRGY